MNTQKIKEVKKKYSRNNLRGSIASLIIEFGELKGILQVYGSVDAFCRDLLKAGYDKGYISRIRRKLKR